MMNKNDIINFLKKYNINPNEAIILSGASMVLNDIKEYTNDIDISVSIEYEKFLLENYDCKLEKITPDGHKVWFIDDVINFSNNYWNCFPTNTVNGYRIQTLNSVLELKNTLNREKDKKDICLLEKR